MALLQITEPEDNQKVVVGIDLGTTNSLVASYINNQYVILKDDNGNDLIPSVVYYDKNNKVLVGHAATKFRITDPANTITSIKRLLGKNRAEIPPYLYDFYEFVNQNNIVTVKTNCGNKNPIEISSEILKKLKTIAINNLNSEIYGAVITVPAYFNDEQRQATKLAAQIANISVLRLLNEPTAAAIAYGLDSKNKGTCLIYDIGGGTLDVSILDIKNGIFEVIVVAGDNNLGGDDFDLAIYNFILHNSDLKLQAPSDKVQLLEIAKNIKEELTTKEIVEKTIEFNNQKLNLIISNEMLNNICQDLVNKALSPIHRALIDAKLDTNNIDEIIMVGGASRIPILRSKIKELFNKNPLTSIDPDKVVAIGAAMQAQKLISQNNDLLLLDVTPLSLGIETIGGAVEKIIPRNSVIPISITQDFTTYADNQTAFSIHILQGESEFSKDCRSLARFSLKGILPMPKGMARIRITFVIDSDGILSVMAKDLMNNNQMHVEVNPTSGLSQDDILKMVSHHT